VPIVNADGTIKEWFGAATDITARRRAEEALKEASQRKDEFLATLAHELRNPLAPISNALYLLRNAHAGKRRTADRLVGMMDRQVAHMVRLVDDLLEVARITQGKIELAKERVDLGDILRSAVETSMPLIQKGKHRLTLALPEHSFWISGDAVRLNQVFANLLNNAAKYTDDGGHITVTVGSEGHQAMVSVRDNGIGIPPDMLDQVFEMFRQVCGTRHKGRGGLGIGLAMAQRLAQLHGGTIEAHSEGLSLGSEFIVRLPLLESVQPHASQGMDPHHRLDAPLDGCSVLVVDDNQDAADTLAALLETDGAEVHIVHDGWAALAELDNYHPQAVILDIGLPDISGYEVAQQIRSKPDFDDVRLIALTGWGQQNDRLRSRDCGFNEHLTKPVNFAVLESLLIKHHALSSGRGQPPR
jgi:CheY-like chemotaxis protein/nitrogen-specific signal transduction histidine kinase